MKQLNFVGADAPHSPVRPLVYSPSRALIDEKERLRLDLLGLLKTIPRNVASAGIQTTRSYIEAHKAAMKTAKCTRSTGQQLRAAIGNMRRFE